MKHNNNEENILIAILCEKFQHFFKAYVLKVIMKIFALLENRIRPKVDLMEFIIETFYY